MYDLLTLKNSEDYFKVIRTREKPGVFFCRFIGFDDEKNILYKRIHIAAKNKGIYINKTLNNPTEKEVEFFFRTIGNEGFSLNTSYLKKAVDAWLNTVNQQKRQLFYDALLKQLTQLFEQGINLNIIKNAFVKFMCWSRYVFEGLLNHLGDDDTPKILYEGDITKYELYMLHILSLSGCDILYIHFMGEDSYLNIDKKSEYSSVIYAKRRGEPPIHFTKIDINAVNKLKEMEEYTSKLEGTVVTNTWLEESLLLALMKKNAQRGVLSKSKIYNLFGCYMGVDIKEQYLNRLYELKEDFNKNQKPYIMIEGKMGNPTMEEVAAIQSVNYTNRNDLIQNITAKIQVSQDKVLNALVQSAFMNMLKSNKESTVQKLYNDSMKFLCWINRYANVLFQKFHLEQIPVFLYYGKCTESEGEFLSMLSDMPVDVVILCSDKTIGETWDMKKKKNILIEELPQSMPVGPFPKQEIKIRMATAAYSAQRELDTMLYSGSGLFRNRQFTRSKAVTLKTTYEEISILWKEEAKYRPGFEAERGMVSVPNIFAKICGVKDGDIGAYYKTIENMYTNQTILLQKIPYITNDAVNTIKPFVPKFIERGRILPQAIKKHKQYQYDFLNEDTQDYILEKIQEVIDLNWIKSDAPDISCMILSTLLNLNKTTLQMIQQFDFTKEIPKLIAVDVDESMFSPEDCIYILFLNLVGFDIVIFTPTGYRNIEKYMSQDAFEQHQIGAYLYNLAMPVIKQNGASAFVNGGNTILGRLFGRGRN